jgi:ABC-type sugar transport system substrate-binding protein
MTVARRTPAATSKITEAGTPRMATNGLSATPAEIYSAWEALLRANPDAVAVLSPSAQDATAWGLLAKRTGFKLPAGGFDLEAGNMQAVKDGSVT